TWRTRTPKNCASLRWRMRWWQASRSRSWWNFRNTIRRKLFRCSTRESLWETGKTRSLPAAAETSANKTWRAVTSPAMTSARFYRRALVVNGDPVGNATDRHRDFRFAGFGVDHGDVVAIAVGDIKRVLVARQRQAPGPLADQDVA